MVVRIILYCILESLYGLVRDLRYILNINFYDYNTYIYYFKRVSIIVFKLFIKLVYKVVFYFFM